MSNPPTWSERIYLHNRRKLGWLLPLLTILGIFDVWILFRAATAHFIYGRTVAGPGYIWLANDPSAFWYTVAIHSVGLVPVVLIPVWVFLGYRATVRRRRLPEPTE